MTEIKRKDIKLLSFDELSNELGCSTYLQEELLSKQCTIVHQVNSYRDELMEKEKVIDSQKSRLRRLKSFIEMEQGGKEQLEATLSQNSTPPNIKEKLLNIKGQLKRSKQEEEKLFGIHFSTLETVRELNRSIVSYTDDITELDRVVSDVKKDIAILKHGLNKLKLQN